MSPTVFRYKEYHFFFFSNEEARMHVHVAAPDGEAKFWIEPVVALADQCGLSSKQLREMSRIVEEHQNEIKRHWKKHFNR